MKEGKKYFSQWMERKKNKVHRWSVKSKDNDWMSCEKSVSCLQDLQRLAHTNTKKVRL